MSSNRYNGGNISDFLSNSVGGVLSDIETAVIEMMNEKDRNERENLKFEIQGYIEKINDIIG